ncbi:hypothetical protein NKR23_g10944 [Pleurostoma richardsiae]|uniref:NACHT domain-containing protein n=1 Tax=Pleurostoma richardsiae TaxID=41990 RepID=A0AA38VKS7_9PEZI|nr:hypothetical protein NKR23_g10944 [Pleurostoma richardsiae]
MQARADMTLEPLKEWLAAATSLPISAECIHRDSCSWFGDNDSFRSWHQSETSGLLWVHGKSGCGKSVLASNIIGSQSQTTRAVFSYAFQSNTQFSNPSNLAASLLGQALCGPLRLTGDQYADIIPNIQQMRRESLITGPQSCSFGRLWPLALKLLILQPEYFLVVDALDECDASHLSLVVEALVELPNVTKGKIIIFSQPQPSLKKQLDSTVQIALTEGMMAAPIASFVSAEIQQVILSPEEREKVINRITSLAEGSFLWVTIVVSHLKSHVGKDFLKRLEKTPRELGRLYDGLLRVNADPDDVALQKRRQILVMLCGARQTLSAKEIAAALQIRADAHEEIITRLCKPLAILIGGKVSFTHSSVREFLLDERRLPITEDPEMTVFVTSTESDACLALQCLETLLAKTYSSLERIGHLLRSNYGHKYTASFYYDDPDNDPENGLSYSYSARFWFVHITAVPSPNMVLLDRLEEFLHSLNFVFWGETTLKGSSDFSEVISAHSALEMWYSSLPEDKRRHVSLGDYFSAPYKSASREYHDSAELDTVLEWLPLMRLGYYYVTIADVEATITLREQVAQGLVALLGSHHPLALRARADVAFSYMHNGRLREAHSVYSEVVEIERDVIGTRDPEYFRTMLYKGQAEYYMTDFSSSLATQRTSSTGLLKTSGPDSFMYQASKLWYALPLIEVGELEMALDLLDSVFSKRREKYGNDDNMATMFQVPIGSIQRKSGPVEECIMNLQQALSSRLLKWPLSHFLSLDVAIELLIAFRDFGRTTDAREQLSKIERDGNVPALPGRHCQVQHLKALLLADGGELDQAIDLLQDLVITTGRDEYTRALLWVIIDLADLLRRRGGEGDSDRASSNFDGLVVERDESSPQLADELEDAFAVPDPPRLLNVAEKALRLVRGRKFEEAKELLDRGALAWAREDDFYLWVGGPAADTTWMRAP